MMSKKQWFVLLCLLVIYLLLGASVFHEIEKREEFERRIHDRIERKEIEELLLTHYYPTINDTTEDLFVRLTKYCGKPVRKNMTEHEEPLKWDFYHSLFFVITVVSTIGYGNLAPTTMIGRIFMIFYGLVGIPINGIVMVTLGDFFGKKFINLYNRWKSAKIDYETARLGFIGQIILYLVPGFTLLVFIPSVIIMIFEGWAYDVSVYYAFVTLTTIGFGDYVAGVNDNGFGEFLFVSYKIFLLVWIIIGLGYVVMVLGFISRGLRSKKMQELEHMLAYNIKRTPQKIREELRTLLHDMLLMKVKRVYKEEFIYTPKKIERSQSCPDLQIYRSECSPASKRKRAYSESVQKIQCLQRVQSDTELEKIDKERTFEPTNALMEQSDLLLRVVNALGNYESSDSEHEGGVNCFSDAEILSSEKFAVNPKYSMAPKQMRKRACSEVQFPFEDDHEKVANFTWYGPSATKKLLEIRERVKYGKARSRTLPFQQQASPSGLLFRIKNTFKSPSKESVKSIDVERQVNLHPAGNDRQEYLNKTARGRLSMFDVNQYHFSKRTGKRKFSVPDPVLENTSIADLFRALTAIGVPEAVNTSPRRKLGTASLTPPGQLSPPRSRRLPIRPTFQPRRSSLMPITPITENKRRRFSLRPAPLINEVTDFLGTPQPPPYTPLVPDVRRSIRAAGSERRYSLRPVVANISNTPSPVQRQIMKTKDKDES